MIQILAAPITNLASLRAALQDALRLEFFTIPPYLIAHHTLSRKTAGALFARRTIQGIVREEMLHMNLVCNILNAIGGTPDIKAAVPTYPHQLPMALADGLKVHLKRYSRELVASVFMQIEMPETPIKIPVKHDLLAAAVAPRTIGQFYTLIRNELERQANDGIFTGPKERQVNLFLMDEGATTVTDLTTAQRAIDIIVQQGEGTPKSPIDLQNGIAHYYRFEQLADAMKLEPLPKPHFDPTETVVVDDDADVIRMVDDPQLVAIDPIDAHVKELSDECDKQFSSIVDTLHAGFSKDPNQLLGMGDTMDIFGDSIDELLAQPLTAGPNAGFHAGPRYLYTQKP